ncbi:MAG: hypothetical protein K2X81_07070 [Candidatus Obscuribacterales bacterium]|nr:hypothetical protein [Candidatus Obscuribacterales bacterium]
MSYDKPEGKENAEFKGVSENSAMHSEIWTEMKANSLQNKASKPCTDEFLNIPPVSTPGYGHSEDDLHTHNTRTPNGMNHSPMDMVISSGHSVGTEMSMFANPSLRDNLLPQAELIRMIPPPELPHRNHATPPAEGGAAHAPIEGQIVVANTLSPSSLRVPELPRLQPIPSPPLEINHQRNAERARQAAEHDPFHGANSRQQRR